MTRKKGNRPKRSPYNSTHQNGQKVPSMPPGASTSKQGIPSSGEKSQQNFQGDELALTRAERNQRLWLQRFGELVEFKKKNGHCRVPRKFPANQKLGNWVKTQRERYGGKRADGAALTAEQIAKLGDLGFEWVIKRAIVPWEKRMEDLAGFKKQFGHCRVPRGYKGNKSLAAWVDNTRQRKNLTREQLDELDAIGFEWNGKRPSRGLKTNAGSDKIAKIPAATTIGVSAVSAPRNLAKASSTCNEPEVISLLESDEEDNEDQFPKEEGGGGKTAAVVPRRNPKRDCRDYSSHNSQASGDVADDTDGDQDYSSDSDDEDDDENFQSQAGKSKKRKFTNVSSSNKKTRSVEMQDTSNVTIKEEPVDEPTPLSNEESHRVDPTQVAIKQEPVEENNGNTNEQPVQSPTTNNSTSRPQQQPDTQPPLMATVESRASKPNAEEDGGVDENNHDRPSSSIAAPLSWPTKKQEQLNALDCELALLRKQVEVEELKQKLAKLRKENQPN